MPTPGIKSGKKIRDFLQAVAEGKSDDGAAKIAGFSLRSAYRWRKTDAIFHEQWEEARSRGTDFLEDKALEFSTVGIVEFEVIKTVTAKDGTKTETRTIRRRVSERLLELQLKARRPERYREASKDHAPPGGGVGEETNAFDRITQRLDAIARRTNGSAPASGEVIDLKQPDATGSGEAGN